MLLAEKSYQHFASLRLGIKQLSREMLVVIKQRNKNRAS
jgi:predicted lactoylglutathione lyase